jgi:hypothetical protein
MGPSSQRDVDPGYRLYHYRDLGMRCNWRKKANGCRIALHKVEYCTLFTNPRDCNGCSHAVASDLAENTHVARTKVGASSMKPGHSVLFTGSKNDKEEGHARIHHDDGPSRRPFCLDTSVQRSEYLLARCSRETTPRRSIENSGDDILEQIE